MERFARRHPAAIALAAAVVAGCSAVTAGAPVRTGPVDAASSMTAEPVPGTAPVPGTEAAPGTEPAPGTGPVPGTGAGSCAATTAWGTAEQSAEMTSRAPIRAVSATAGDCFDEFSIEIGPGTGDPGYLVRYVDALTQDGSGAEIPLAAAATLLVVIDSPAYDPETGVGTLQIPDHDHVVDAAGLTVIRQVAFAGSFEGRSTFGIGVDGRRPFTVAAGSGESGPTLAVRIAHG